MKDGPMIATVAALIGDPARANMLNALVDGRALTASELAGAAGVAAPTASGHLARLTAAKLICVERQGRHRYFRLADDDVAGVLEALMGLAERTGATRVHAGPRDAALRASRICYDHLAGARGVALFGGAVGAGLIAGTGDLALTEQGRATFTAFGIDLSLLERGRRPMLRPCLDWSERRNHLGGALGAAVLALLLARGWAKRGVGRVILVTPAGDRALAALAGGAISP
jgi:DNA-binding transcriptional ArsR family regulator